MSKFANSIPYTLSTIYNTPTPQKINEIPEYNGLPLYSVILKQHYTQSQINAHKWLKTDPESAINDLLTSLIQNGLAYITDPLTGEILWEPNSQGA